MNSGHRTGWIVLSKHLAENNVALEINAKLKLPSPEFIKRAKASGVKFTFGTNNGGADDLGRLEYCIDMVTECGLTSQDMWIPEKSPKVCPW